MTGPSCFSISPNTSFRRLSALTAGLTLTLLSLPALAQEAKEASPPEVAQAKEVAGTPAESTPANADETAAQAEDDATLADPTKEPGTDVQTSDEPKADAAPAAPEEAHEDNCTDGIDNDGDTVYDCMDADCFENPVCSKHGGFENTNALCSDWIDNDGNGHKDCDDDACNGSGVTVCEGSWSGPLSGAPVPAATSGKSDAIPELGEGMTVEDLLGKGDDKDGERNNQSCTDGIDNDNDGKTDCADLGCRFDPNVTVCRGTPGIRFSMVAQVTHAFTVVNTGPQINKDILGDIVDHEPDAAVRQNGEPGAFETRFTALQLRAFGPLPGIQESFFLISGRAERSPRLTFAMANFPIGHGHFLNINSGGGGLSNALILSASKRLLVDAPFYVYNAFEQGNGAAAELNGPLWPGWLDYRVFVAGGSGFFNGNVGGRFFAFDNQNYTYSVGGALALQAVGYINRWDSPFLYTKVPLALATTLGVKYDQRAQERYPALNLSMVARWSYFILTAESYMKRELEFQSNQISYNVTAGALLWPKHIMAAVDVGQFIAGDLGNPPAQFQTDLRRQRNEFMWRAALHWYFYRNIGIASLVFSDRYVGSGVSDANRADVDTINTRTVKLVSQFRF